MPLSPGRTASRAVQEADTLRSPRRGLRRWGRHTVTYFVADPRSGLFAPSKFCAYVDVTASTQGAAMTVARYLSLDEAEPRFDGHRARVHLTRHLAFVEQPLGSLPSLQMA